MTTLDPAPLLAAAAIGVVHRNGEHDTQADERGHPPDRALARRLGVTVRSIQRWRHGTTLSVWHADRLAIRLGLHPVEVWGRDFYAVVDGEES